jgi:hypothetical protein
MAKTMRLAILLIAILCLVPGCDDETGGETDPNGPCDPSLAADRCLGTSLIQICSDESGTWETVEECGANHRCTERDFCDVWRERSGMPDCPDYGLSSFRRSEGFLAVCEYVEPLDGTSCSAKCKNDCAAVSCICVSETNGECLCVGCGSESY